MSHTLLSSMIPVRNSRFALIVLHTAVVFHDFYRQNYIPPTIYLYVNYVVHNFQYVYNDLL